MKSIRFKILMIFLIFIVLLISGKSVFAKYIINPSTALIIETSLDRTPPILKTSYSTSSITNGDVTVTIKSNEKLKEVNGWTLSSDKLTLTKTYPANRTENIDVFDLAGNKSTANINITNIDKIIPTVQKTAITNSNTSHTNYANSSKEINLTFKVSDNIGIKNIDTSKMTIKVGSNVAILNKTLTEISSNSKEKIYTLKLTNIKGDGLLTITFESGFVTDTANNKNVKTDINTGITIDNTAPKITYSQSSLSQGKIKAMLNANENIDKLDGWNITSDNKQNYKEFTSNVSYNITLKDWAGNTVTSTVNVTGATYIKLTYASHNSNIGWTYRTWQL